VLPLQFRRTAFVPISVDEQAEASNCTKLTECMSIALFVTSSGVMLHHGTGSFLNEVLLQPFGGDSGDGLGEPKSGLGDIGLGLSQNVFGDMAAALTVIHAVTGGGDVKVLSSDGNTTGSSGSLYGLLTAQSPKEQSNALDVDVLRQPNVGPESIAGRLYSGCVITLPAPVPHFCASSCAFAFMYACALVCTLVTLIQPSGC
jgi:hypothetical protein